MVRIRGYIRSDRPLTAHGPFIRTLLVLQAVTALCATIALVFTMVQFSTRLSQTVERADIAAAKVAAIQRSRSISLHEICTLLQGLIATGTRAQERKQGLHKGSLKANANAYLKENGLENCDQFVRNLTRLPSSKTP